MLLLLLLLQGSVNMKPALYSSYIQQHPSPTMHSTAVAQCLEQYFESRCIECHVAIRHVFKGLADICGEHHI